MPTSQPLVRVLRGGLEESVHVGALVVVEGERVLLARGDPERAVFYRSASKPIQALEVLRCGAAEAYGLSDAELAIAAGSHSGEPRHLATVRFLLQKAGVPESALACGGHRSVNPEVALAQRAEGVPVTAILSNCSGKHAAMLAAARHRGEPLEGYLDLGHPVQQAILGHVATLSGLPRAQVGAAVDGCGAPALVVSLRAMARSLARLVAPRDLPDDLAAAAGRVTRAMLAHPEMVAGTERFDTDLMAAAPGRLLAKAGAEGVHVVAWPERGLALAVKVDDGSDRGYRLAVVEVLHRLGALEREAADAVLARHAAPVLKNLAGREVGRLELAFAP